MTFTRVQSAFMQCLLLLALTSGTPVAHGKDVSIYQNKDKFSGNTVYFTEQERPNLEGGSFVSMRYVYISFNAAAPVRAPEIAYSINIEANLQDWIFIREGESMILLVDGQSIPILGLGSSGARSVSSLGVKEVALYPFSFELLRKLASAQRIEFRVYGTQGNITGEFTPRIMEQLRFFAQEAPKLINDPNAIPQPGPASAKTENPAEGKARESYEVVGNIHVINIGTTAFSVSNVPYTAPNYELSTTTKKDTSLKSSLVFGEPVSENEVRSVLEIFYKNTNPGFDSKTIRNLKVGVPTYAVWCSDSTAFGCRQKNSLAGTLVEYEIDSPMQSGATELRKVIQLMRKFSNAAEYR